MIPTASSKFSAGAQSGSFNHGHASQMAHSAALRMQAARALSGRPTAVAPHPAGGPSGAPGGAPQNYKAAVVGQAGRIGHQVTVQHVHSAIDRMASKGHITPFQAGALKAHNGALKGPQGAATQQAIMREMLAQKPA